ncbi:MAG: hypothetical protein V1697_02235 [Candidatus Levyibacteriota bacterium]
MSVERKHSASEKLGVADLLLNNPFISEAEIKQVKGVLGIFLDPNNRFYHATNPAYISSVPHIKKVIERVWEFTNALKGFRLRDDASFHEAYKTLEFNSEKVLSPNEDTSAKSFLAYISNMARIYLKSAAIKGAEKSFHSIGNGKGNYSEFDLLMESIEANQEIVKLAIGGSIIDPNYENPYEPILALMADGAIGFHFRERILGDEGRRVDFPEELIVDFPVVTKEGRNLIKSVIVPLENFGPGVRVTTREWGEWLKRARPLVAV